MNSAKESEGMFMTLEAFKSMQSFAEMMHLNDHFKQMVTSHDGSSQVDNENDKYYAEMAKLAITKVIGLSGSKSILVTGSASQRLKCVSNEEQGDIDILFLSSFPTMAKEDQENALVPCNEPGFFKIKQLDARKYPFVNRNGEKFLNANSLRSFDPIWFSRELQLPLMVVESMDHEYEKAGKEKVASELDWRSSNDVLATMHEDVLHKHVNYFKIFLQSYKDHIVPILNEKGRNHAEKLMGVTSSIVTFSSLYSSGQAKLAIETLDKLGPDFVNGLVPALLGFMRDTEESSVSFIKPADAMHFIKAYQYFENFAADAARSETHSSMGDTEVRGSFDLVPAISCSGFPLIANDWQKRVQSSSWPSHEVISSILEAGFDLVPKVSKKPGGDSSTSFRLAFNIAEQLLAKSLTKFQRECFRVFKMYFYEKLKRKPKVLTTYHLKTVFFWVLETSAPSIWKEENRAYCCILLFQFLKNALSKMILRHYFIPESNMFKYLDKQELQEISKGLDSILADPVSASGEKIEQIKAYYSSNPGNQQSFQDNDSVDGFFIKSAALFDKVMDELQGSKLLEAEENDETKINLLLFLTDPKNTAVLRFSFDLVLARNYLGRFHRLFTKYAPLASPMASTLQFLFPVSNKILNKVVLPLVPKDSRMKKKVESLQDISKIAIKMSYEDLLDFAMMRNMFASKSKEKFEMIADEIQNRLPFHSKI